MQFLVFVVIIAVAVGLAVALVVMRRRGLIVTQPDDTLPKNAADVGVACCGQHDVCEAETLLTLSEEIIYYSDEELDVYKGVAEDAYSPNQIDEFRDVLLELRPYEVSGWLKSLGLRKVNPPAQVREEALMIVDDFRRQRRISHT